MWSGNIQCVVHHAICPDIPANWSGCPVWGGMILQCKRMATRKSYRRRKTSRSGKPARFQCATDFEWNWKDYVLKVTWLQSMKWNQQNIYLSAQPIFIKFLSHKLLVVSLMAELLNATNLRVATNSKSGRGCESTARCILEPILDDAARLESWVICAFHLRF